MFTSQLNGQTFLGGEDTDITVEIRVYHDPLSSLLQKIECILALTQKDLQKIEQNPVVHIWTTI